MKALAFAAVLSFLALPIPALSQSNTEASDMPYSGAPCTAEGGIKPSARQVALFNRFDAALRSALKRNDVAAVAFLTHFPLEVNTNKGTLLIPDAQSLSGHYAEIFPAEIRSTILATGPDDYICRYDEGLGYKTGAIWVSTNGERFTLQSVNTPDLYAKTNKPALIYTCETKTHRISVEELDGDKFRYRSWNKPKELSDAPDVDIPTGALHFEGTGICSYAVYSFKKGNAEYNVDQGLGCTAGHEPVKATGNLTVTVDGKQVTDTPCF